MRHGYALTGKEPLIREIAAASFPSYRGRKFRLVTAERVSMGDTYWDGGSRSSYAAVSLIDGCRAVRFPNWAPPQFGGPTKTPEVNLTGENGSPPFIVVEHVIFCGKDLGLRIYVPPALMNPSLLPVDSGASDRDAKLLNIFCGLKSFARPQYLSEVGATTEELQSLCERGYLKPQRGKLPHRIDREGWHQKGSCTWTGYDYDLAGCRVTVKGRNARSGESL